MEDIAGSILELGHGQKVGSHCPQALELRTLLCEATCRCSAAPMRERWLQTQLSLTQAAFPPDHRQALGFLSKIGIAPALLVPPRTLRDNDVEGPHVMNLQGWNG